MTSIKAANGLRSRLADTPGRYGLVSRALHFATAYLVLWQLLTLIGWRVFGENPTWMTIAALGPSHGTVGLMVLVLLALRVPHAIRSSGHRPALEKGWRGRLSRAVHLAFYALLFAVPSLSLVRAYGNGKGYDLWGFPLIPATGREIEALTAPADALHGPLAWTLAALVVLHLVAVLFHVRRRDGIAGRMTGRLHGTAG